MPKSVNDTQSKKNRTVVTKLENSVSKAIALASSRTKEMHELDRFSYRVDRSNSVS